MLLFSEHQSLLAVIALICKPATNLYEASCLISGHFLTHSDPSPTSHDLSLPHTFTDICTGGDSAQISLTGQSL